MGISEDLKQRTFISETSKSVVNIIFTGNWMMQKMHELLKPFGLTPQQYNVLRILRGQQNNPMTVLAITERMLDKTSNASRLVDKLLEKKFVLRKECPHDRRAVDIIILPAGLTILGEIDQVQKAWEMNFQSINPDKMSQLNDLLDEFRSVFTNN
ncbi:MarR family winged helix-turn-helix transcriptional regulator [Aquirufa sp.]|jgi:DNA-binding MarR family transcriptional regulator|uniref:MarR family winged helix-turn-helix transcriptional regulator n=1 Tax=Aquirufa sp. TaxID=2676249 RepID=UPI0037C12702